MLKNKKKVSLLSAGNIAVIHVLICVLETNNPRSIPVVGNVKHAYIVDELMCIRAVTSQEGPTSYKPTYQGILYQGILYQGILYQGILYQGIQICACV